MGPGARRPTSGRNHRIDTPSWKGAPHEASRRPPAGRHRRPLRPAQLDVVGRARDRPGPHRGRDQHHLRGRRHHRRAPVPLHRRPDHAPVRRHERQRRHLAGARAHARLGAGRRDRHRPAGLGVWYAGLGPSFTSVAGQNVGYDPATGSYLVEYDNGFYATSGACADPSSTASRCCWPTATGRRWRSA